MTGPPVHPAPVHASNLGSGGARAEGPSGAAAAASPEPVRSPTRLRIIQLILDRPRTVCEVARCVGVNKSAVHRHLQRLVAERVLTRASHGKWVYYRPAADLVAVHAPAPVPTRFASRASPSPDDAEEAQRGRA